MRRANAGGADSGGIPEVPGVIAPPRELPPARLPAGVQTQPKSDFLPDVIPPKIPRADGDPPARTSQPECPVAPPELMVPSDAVTPGKHAAFGSPPMRISADYGSLRDLCEIVRGGFASRDLRGDRVAAGRGEASRGGGAYLQGEFLLWWMKGLDIPVLGTTNTQGGFGFLNEPGTLPIIGPGEFIGTFRQGFRGRAGWWFNDSTAIEGSFFYLARRESEVVAVSEEFGIITRPIFSPNMLPSGVIGFTGEAVAVPGILTGSLAVEAESVLWGFDANIRCCLKSCCDRRWTGFAGYRNLNLSEELTITENIAVIGPGAGVVLINDPVGSTVVVQDRFATDNHFNGGQIGLTYERRWGRLALDARTSIAIGATRQEIDISGFQTRTRPGQPPATFSGGLLAAGPNLGSFSQNAFSVVPEFTLNAGVMLTPTLKVYIGYNFLFWTNVLRTGDQIDPVVDLTFVPNAPAVPPSGLNRPAPPFRETDLWVTGLQFGVQWRW
jgi:hypothetical protein